jgi:hypothetical protein
MQEYSRNHYVPQWYLRRFFSSDATDRRFYYLDLHPETVSIKNGVQYTRNAIRRLGTASCFCQDDLYTTHFGTQPNRDIEKFFFGRIDGGAARAMDFFEAFEHPDADANALQTMMEYLSVQKLRTPKGLQYLDALFARSDRNRILIAMQTLKDVHCALWIECVWSIWDASASGIKFIVSDHPVTIYNQRCFPDSDYCKDYRDPDIALNGTCTLFPLSRDRLLVLTNLSWVRNPYQSPLSKRPNPNPFRDAMFNFNQIQTHRTVHDSDVATVNYIIKRRAYRYIASPERDWLFPESMVGETRWDQIGLSYFLMPDPRSVEFASGTFIRYASGHTEAYDEYGRPPTKADADEEDGRSREWKTFHAFQGEYARRFGPARQGRTYMAGRLEPAVDSADYHAYHLSLESRNPKPRLPKKQKKRRF